jgi:hypothetical protein
MDDYDISISDHSLAPLRMQCNKHPFFLTLLHELITQSCFAGLLPGNHIPAQTAGPADFAAGLRDGKHVCYDDGFVPNNRSHLVFRGVESLRIFGQRGSLADG